MRQKLCLSIGGILGLLVALNVYCLRSLGDSKLHVYMLNIGQGDAIFIRTPTQEHILVDGGPDNTVVKELSGVMPFYDRTIDLLVLSHGHADHVNGFIDVLRRYDVKRVMITGANSSSPGYKAFLNEVAEKKVPVVFATGKNDFRFHNVIVDIVYPLTSLQGRSFENLNNSSIVFRLLYGKNSFLLEGDLEIEGEKLLVESGLDVRAEIIKAGHHGSRTSSSEPLLEAVKPSYALISCGIENKFKHPHAETIRHFQERAIAIYRTDLDGRIEVVGDGKTVRLLKKL